MRGREAAKFCEELRNVPGHRGSTGLGERQSPKAGRCGGSTVSSGTTASFSHLILVSPTSLSAELNRTATSKSINSKSKQHELAPVTQTGEEGPGGAQGSEAGSSLVVAGSECSLLFLCSTGNASSPHHRLVSYFLTNFLHCDCSQNIRPAKSY